MGGAMGRDAVAAGGHADLGTRNALAAAGVGVWLLDVLNQQVDIDETLAQVLDLPQMTAQRMPLDEFLACFDSDDQARFETQISLAAKGGAALNTAAQRAQSHADGGAVYLAVRGRLLGGADDAAPVLGGACWDISDTKRLEYKLQQLSVRDALTNLYNRRYFDDNIEREWKIGLREKMPLSLGFVDVDHFKAYNDALGHQTGDRCLIRLANAIRDAVVRPADFVARYGGEEFVFVLPATPAEGAMNVAQRVMDAIASERIAHPDSPLGKYVTVSIGVATWTDPSAETPIQSLIQQADDAMYAAKEQGRARIVQWQNGLPQSQRERLA